MISAVCATVCLLWWSKVKVLELIHTVLHITKCACQLLLIGMHAIFCENYFFKFSIIILSIHSLGVARDMLKISKMFLECHKAKINAWKSCWKSLCVVLMSALCLSVKHALVDWYGGIKTEISCRIYLNLQKQVNSTPGTCIHSYMYLTCIV